MAPQKCSSPLAGGSRRWRTGPRDWKLPSRVRCAWLSAPWWSCRPMFHFLGLRLFLSQSDDGLRSGDILHGNFHLIAVVHRIEHQGVLHPEVAAGALGETQGDAVVSLVDAGNH